MAANGTYACSTIGLMFPLTDEREWLWAVRALVYLAGLLYTFLGVAIAADLFMCAIERITSQTLRRRVKAERDDDGLPLYRDVAVWNPTVANLTLMALGSSAPEILLAIIEIVGHGFVAGDLGPSTIVGSAAFNLLCITAVCVLSIPANEGRRVREIYVFAATAAFSIFAYIWLLLILVVWSADYVEIWEGAATLLFFGVLVAAAYAADRRFCCTAAHSASDVEADKLVGKPDLKEVNRQVALDFPNLQPDQLARMVAWRMKMAEPKNRAWYRIQATRWLTSSAQKESFWNASAMTEGQTEETAIAAQADKPLVEFAARVYAVDPRQSAVTLTVVRKGRPRLPLMLRYETVNGRALREVHFRQTSELLSFESGESEKSVEIELLADVEWRHRDVFFVQLELITQDEGDRTELGACKVAEVVFLEDGERAFEFANDCEAVEESAGCARLHVRRTGGFADAATLRYDTEDIEAEAGADYVAAVGAELHFAPGDVERYIDVIIIDDMEEEKDETFAVTLSQVSSGFGLGAARRAIITILCDDGILNYFRQMDKMIPEYMHELTPGTCTWKEQIVNGISVNAGDLEAASLGDCFAHVLAFPWKVLFALVPPPHLLGGWLTFFVVLALIGFLTAIVGDLAAIFGCLVNLKDAVTAITLVALGTSLPDLFASRFAALQDPHADNSIGNVTGSNSVNVFLGLGLPWLAAAVYWGGRFHVPSGDLAFSVGVYTVCALLAVGLLLARRKLSYFGCAELGGPRTPRLLSAAFLFTLWLLYIGLSAKNAYKDG